VSENKDRGVFDVDDNPIVYSRGEKIGQGAYGTVFQGLDSKKGNLLAIKNI